MLSQAACDSIPAGLQTYCILFLQVNFGKIIYRVYFLLSLQRKQQKGGNYKCEY